MLSEHRLDILLIHAQSTDLNIFKDVFENLNQNLILANSSEEICKYLQHYDLGMIFLDTEIVGIDFQEIIKIIRLVSDIPIVLITTVSEPLLIETNDDIGIIDYLFKPIHPALLVAKIKILGELFYKNIKIKEQTALLNSINQELQASEEWLQEFLNHANDLTQIISPNGKFIYVNQVWQETLGYDAKTAANLCWFDIIHPDYRESAITLINSIQTQSASCKIETILIAKDGRHVNVAGIIYCHLENNQLQAIRCLFHDITEHKRAEAALKESEERFRSAFDYAAIGMAMVALDGRWIKVNRSLCEIVGYSESELLKLSFIDITFPDDLEADLNYAFQLLNGEIRYYHMEKRYLHKQGHIVWILLSGSLVRDSQGKPLYFIAQIQDITERRQAEQALRESERRFRAIFDSSFQLIGLLKPDGTLLEANQTALDFGRISSLEVVNRPFWEAHWWQISSEIVTHLREAIAEAATGKFIRYEVDMLGASNQVATIDFSVKPVQNEAGEVVLLIAEGRDISDRKQIEAEKSKLIAILEATPDFVSSTSIDGQIFYFNSATRKILGIAESEALTNLNISQCYPEWAGRIIKNEGIPTALTEGIWVGETAILSHNQQEIPVSQLIIAHKSADGTVKLLSNVARDITQQKQIQATLLETERRWRSLLENVRLLVVGLDQSGKVDYVNPFFLELVGYTQEEVIGKDWFSQFIPQYQKQRVQKCFGEIVDYEFHAHYHNSILTKTGEERLIAWNNTLLRDLHGEMIGTMSIGEDITERYAIERMKDEFISVVSHELRTPLTSIHGALNLLSTGLVDTQSERGKRVIEIAAESAERLVRLVNDILDLERLESGKISLIKQSCNTTDLIAKAINLIEVMAERAEVNLSISVQSIELEADPDRIMQVLTNLLSNAIKFSPKKATVWLSVELIEAEEQEAANSRKNSGYQSTNAKYALFQVKDQGRGIPADKLESIFERFHQVDASDSRKKGGTGLGLAICQSIVQQHGGRIWAESILGQGSSFYFTLPD